MKLRALTILTAASLLAAACGGNDSSTDTTQAPAAPTEAPATTAAGEPGTTTAGEPGTTTAPATEPPVTEEPNAPLDPPVTVRWAVTGLVGEAAIYIAQERGYFEAEGLNVELVDIRRFADVLPLLATGNLELGTGGLNPDVWNAISRDIPVRIIAAHVTQVEGATQSALVVGQQHLDDGTYTELSDLAGFKIGINSLGSSSQFYLEKILDRAGLTLDDVELVMMGFADMAAALTNQGIDAAFTNEPFIINMAKAGIGGRVFTTAEAAPGQIGSVIVIGPSFAENQPEAAERAMYALLKAQREYLDAFIHGTNPEARPEIIEILTRHTTITDPEVFEGMGMSGSAPTLMFELDLLAEFGEYFLSHDVIDELIDPQDMVDFSYLEYANQRLDQES